MYSLKVKDTITSVTIRRDKYSIRGILTEMKLYRAIDETVTIEVVLPISDYLEPETIVIAEDLMLGENGKFMITTFKVIGKGVNRNEYENKSV